MSKGLIVQVKPGKSVPKDIIDKIVSQYKTGFGYASCTGEGTLDTMFIPANSMPVQENLAEVLSQDAYKKHRLFLYFSQAEKLPETDEQPFHVIKQGDKDPPVVAVFVEGELPIFDKKGGHTPAYHFVKDYLDGILKMSYQEVKGDLTNMYKLLDGPEVRAEMQEVLKPSGMVTVVLGNDTTITYALEMKDKIGEYDWGMSSEKLDVAAGKSFAERMAEKRQQSSSGGQNTTEKKELTFAEKMAAKRAAATGGGSTEPPKEENEKEKEDLDQDVGPEITNKPGEELLYPPPELQSNRQQLKKWYPQNFRLGQAPKNWRSRPGVSVALLKPDSPLRQTLKSMKDLATASGNKNTTSVPSVTVEPQAIIGPDEKKMSKAFFDKLPMRSAAEIEAEVKKFGSGTEQLGLKLSDVLKLDTKSIALLVKERQKTATCLLLEVIAELAKVHPALMSHEDAAKEGTQEDTGGSSLTFQQRMAAKRAAASKAA